MITVWRNSYNAQSEPVAFAGGWIVGNDWKNREWRHNEHAVIETRELHFENGAVSNPIRGGDVFFSHPALNVPDPTAKFFHAKTGLTYEPETLGDCNE